MFFSAFNNELRCCAYDRPRFGVNSGDFDMLVRDEDVIIFRLFSAGTLATNLENRRSSRFALDMHITLV